ncbi:MAG TPA: hypothetical protein VFC51_16635 [Chloroflexota bacterium]|nr:hypothetical protein [Chloroflexota bacterium]
MVDWQDQSVQICRRASDRLQIAVTLTAEDMLTSPMLPGFGLALTQLFAPPL